jgi:solute carrier family 35 protein F5
LTTPLVVSVGLSLAIPLSLIGQMTLSQQYSSALYWVGACIVLLSFLFINHKSRDADESSAAAVDEAHEHEGTI